MNINPHLDTLESTGLIRVAQIMPELEYLFRHALVQDAAYDSLLRADRKKLHHEVGHVLEKRGMRQGAHLRDSEYFKGRYWDRLIYAILDSEWTANSPISS